MLWMLNIDEKLAFFAQTIHCLFVQKFDHDIGFWEKREFFRQKLAKIAEHHNIDPKASPFQDYLGCLIVFKSVSLGSKGLGPN
jgi:hypothetical protein